MPYCYGWLFLDRRGHWRMRSEFAQKNHLPGEKIHHLGLIEAIVSHFAIDEKNQYFFQNGPQRVYIDLAYTPYIARLIPKQDSQWLLQTNLHQNINPLRCFLDEKGNILIESEIEISQTHSDQPLHFKSKKHKTVALLHDHDLEIFASIAQLDTVSCGVLGTFKWNHLDLPIEPILSNEIGRVFNFVEKPKPHAG